MQSFSLVVLFDADLISKFFSSSSLTNDNYQLYISWEWLQYKSKSILDALPIGYEVTSDLNETLFHLFRDKCSKNVFVIHHQWDELITHPFCKYAHVSTDMDEDEEDRFVNRMVKDHHYIAHAPDDELVEYFLSFERQHFYDQRLVLSLTIDVYCHIFETLPRHQLVEIQDRINELFDSDYRSSYLFPGVSGRNVPFYQMNEEGSLYIFPYHEKYTLQMLRAGFFNTLMIRRYLGLCNPHQRLIPIPQFEMIIRPYLNEFNLDSLIGELLLDDKCQEYYVDMIGHSTKCDKNDNDSVLDEEESMGFNQMVLNDHLEQETSLEMMYTVLLAIGDVLTVEKDNHLSYLSLRYPQQVTFRLMRGRQRVMTLWDPDHLADLVEEHQSAVKEVLDGLQITDFVSIPLPERKGTIYFSVHLKVLTVSLTLNTPEVFPMPNIVEFVQYLTHVISHLLKVPIMSELFVLCLFPRVELDQVNELCRSSNGNCKEVSFDFTAQFISLNEFSMSKSIEWH